MTISSIFWSLWLFGVVVPICLMLWGVMFYFLMFLLGEYRHHRTR